MRNGSQALNMNLSCGTAGFSDASTVFRDGLATLGLVAAIEQSEIVTLTERAADKVRALMALEPAGEAEVLRVAVQGGGCGGFEYALGFDRGAVGEDSELEFYGIRVVVDSASAPYLKGAKVDFVESLKES